MEEIIIDQVKFQGAKISTSHSYILMIIHLSFNCNLVIMSIEVSLTFGKKQ